MRGAIRITVVICHLFYPAVFVFAQDIFLKPYEPHSLLLKQENIFKIHFVEPKNNFIEPKIEPLVYQAPNTISYELFSLLLKNNTLFDKYLEDIELYPPKTKLPKLERTNNTNVNHDVFNALYNKPKVNEKDMIRQEWKKIFGIDVWYPYYKAKDVEKWVKRKLSVKIFKFKGEPEFKRDKITYSFKVKF